MNVSNHPSITNETLLNKAQEVEQILSLYKEGKNITEIASTLHFEQS